MNPRLLIQVNVRPTGEGVIKSVTNGSYMLDSLQVRMDWRVIKDFGRALMDDDDVHVQYHHGCC